MHPSFAFSPPSIIEADEVHDHLLLQQPIYLVQLIDDKSPLYLRNNPDKRSLKRKSATVRNVGLYYGDVVVVRVDLVHNDNENVRARNYGNGANLGPYLLREFLGCHGTFY